MSHRLFRALALLTGLASAATSPQLFAAPAPSSDAPLLPVHFSSWTEAGSPQTTNDPAAADAANADVLREYGLKDFSSATYRHAGAQLTVRAYRFADATGAYGAFTFYRQPGMKAADLGKGSAQAGPHVLFWTGSTLVDATAASTAGLHAVLEALAAALPQLPGPSGVPPTLAHYLPKGSLDTTGIRYFTGPVAWAKSGETVPADAVRFNIDAEALTAPYHGSDGDGTLTLLMYPTPQIAAGRAQAIQALIANGSLKGGSGAGVVQKRSGPLVAVTTGNFTSDEAHKLVDQVKFDDFVTVDQQHVGPSEAAKTAKLLTGIATLTVVLGGAAVLLGIFFGGGRAMIRVLRGKPASSLSEEEFISLRLNE